MNTSLLGFGLFENVMSKLNRQIVDLLQTPELVWGPRMVTVVITSDLLDGDIVFAVKADPEAKWNLKWGQPGDSREIASWKAMWAHGHAMPTSMAIQYPASLKFGEPFRYPGGVPSPGNIYAVGVSGANGRTDEAIARMVIALAEMYMHMEVDQAVIEKRKQL